MPELSLPDLFPLPRSLYLSGAVRVARELLGKALVHDSAEGPASGIIVETEAYAGPSDAACHAFGLVSARPGHRTEAMFRVGGHAYIYLIYGMHHCFNVVSGPEDVPEAVLIRALEPLFGLELMERRRGTKDRRKLCSGPGKLCQALGISRDQNGRDLTEGALFVAEGRRIPDSSVAATPRINVDYSGEAAGYPYRFVVEDSPFLSTRRFLKKCRSDRSSGEGGHRASFVAKQNLLFIEP
ncbi:DNA-3-methyladenine glycosylase [Fretibacterium sp. OH1220_COT-178]|uniref:DNA-3-methyladenine glycosylase n=1 Tax=Fretibacterium sp. OH1220_COT-178 TaxID=2491047 RepID=UPI000F5F0467|nr:DNA-3-methyladenine glycosylase [Fretibacterium sp. OH1220_COT-178]RRD65839.1 DNA-3-methyladenine glycosylase [Fretibacterium sp. OH1220_COT-178]